MNLQINFKNDLYTKENLTKASIEEIIEILKKLDLPYLEYKDFLYDRNLLEDKVWSLLREKGKIIDKYNNYDNKILDINENQLQTENFEINSYDDLEIIDEYEEEGSSKKVNIKRDDNFEKKDDLLVYLSSGYMVLKAKGKNNKFALPSTIVMSNDGINSLQFLFNSEKSTLNFEDTFIKDLKDILFDNRVTIKLENSLNVLEIEKDILIYKALNEIVALAKGLLKIECGNIIIICNDEELIRYSLNESNEYVKINSKLDLNLINLISLELYKNEFKEEKFEKNLIILDNYNTLILKSNSEVKEGDFCYIADGSANCIAKNLNMSISSICDFIIKYGYYKCLGLNLNKDILNLQSTEEMYRFLDSNEDFNINKELFDDNLSIEELNKDYNYFKNYNKVLEFIEESKNHKITLSFKFNTEMREISISSCEVNKILSLIIYNNFKEVLRNVKGEIVLIAPMRILRVLREVVKEFIQGNMVSGLTLENIVYYSEKAYGNVCDGIIDHTFTFYGKDIDISVTTLDFKGEEIELINNSNSSSVLYKSIKTRNLELTFKLGGIVKDLKFDLGNFTEFEESTSTELEDKFNIKVNNDIKNSNKIYVILDEVNRSLVLFSIKNEDDKIYISKMENKEF